MISLVKNKIHFDYDKCQQCGACIAVCPVGALSFVRNGVGLADIKVDRDKCVLCGRCDKSCPANKPQDFAGYFAPLQSARYYLAYNADAEVRRASSSGGVCKTLVIEALKSGFVDGVYTLRALPDYPSAVGEFYTKDNLPGYDTMPDSVYHSVLQCLDIAKLKPCRRLMIVGTACQLRSLETALRGRYEQLVKVCIFCKQQKTLQSTRFLAKVAGRKIKPDQAFSATYRGGGWPGTVTINGGSLPWHRAAQIPFGCRLWTVPGCNICGDPFGRLCKADITLMDPWSIRPHNDLGETLVIANTPVADELLGLPNIVAEPKTYADVLSALDLADVRRKQALVPYFRGQHCSPRVALAGIAERTRRLLLRGLVAGPRMPMLYYRALCKLPDLRNLILGKL